MSKFNKVGTRPAGGRGFIVTDNRATGRTHQGAPGYARDNKSELFLLAVTHMPTEKSFAESARDRDSRAASLARAVALTDPAWMVRFVRWLRRDGGMRTSPMLLAAEAVRTRLDAGEAHWDGMNDDLINFALDRADEPGEAVAYWTERYGKSLPRPVRRGLARACVRLYNQKSTIKWDTGGKPWRFGDVIDLCHPDPLTWQPTERDLADGPGRDPDMVAARRQQLRELFGHLLARRRGRDGPTPAGLQTLRANETMWKMTVAQRRAFIRHAEAGVRLSKAGFTHENLASWLERPLDATAWSAMVRHMGYHALLKNLRNMAQAGVTGDALDTVLARIADVDAVRYARVLPMQILAAYRACTGYLQYAYPLETALTASLSNVPEMGGRTLVLVDTSTSMNNTFSEDGTVKRWDAAALFGLAAARRCKDVDVVSFSSTARYWGDAHGAHTKVFDTRAGESLLASVERWKTGGYFLGGGTATAAALRRHYAGHDRVMVVTDEQEGVDLHEVSASVPERTPLITWNLAGEKYGYAPGNVNRLTFGGLTDASFKVLPLLERGRHADWPF